MPSMCLRISARRATRRRFELLRRARGAASFERVSTSSGWAISAISSLTCALDLGHRRDQPRRPRGLGDADVEADVGAAVVLEVGRRGHPLDQLVEPVSPRLGPLGGQHRRPGLDRDPVVEHRPGLLAERLGLALRPAAAARRRRCRRCGPAPRPGARSGPASSAPGAGSSGRSRAVGELALGRKLAARRSRPSRIAVPSRSTVSSKVVGGRTGLNTASSATPLPSSRHRKRCSPAARAGRAGGLCRGEKRKMRSLDPGTNGHGLCTGTLRAAFRWNDPILQSRARFRARFSR